MRRRRRRKKESVEEQEDEDKRRRTSRQRCGTLSCSSRLRWLIISITSLTFFSADAKLFISTCSGAVY